MQYPPPQYRESCGNEETSLFGASELWLNVSR